MWLGFAVLVIRLIVILASRVVVFVAQKLKVEENSKVYNQTAIANVNSKAYLKRTHLFADRFSILAP